MSKIYKKYVNLKEENENKIYLFNTGIFYTIIDDDALSISKILDLKIVNLNNNIKKCGFPVTQLLKYSKILIQNEIEFEIIENDYNKVENTSKYIEYINNIHLISKLLNFDPDDITPVQALNILYELKENIQLNNE